MKKFKKSWATYVGAFALMLALGVASFVGFSYSKYVKSTDNGTETGTVSKFGVTLSSTGELFATQYATTDDNYDEDTDVPYIENSVISSSDTLAPGTSNPGTGLKLTATVAATNEVAVEIVVNLSAVFTNWVVNGVEYKPVNFTISRTETGVEGSTEIENFETYTKVVAPNEAYTVSYTITWVWAFEGNKYLCTTASAGHVVGELIDATAYADLGELEQTNFITTDEADTILGEAANRPTIIVTSSITATQVD